MSESKKMLKKNTDGDFSNGHRNQIREFPLEKLEQFEQQNYKAVLDI